MDQQIENNTLIERVMDRFDNKMNPILKDMPLVGSPIPTLSILLVYMLAVKLIGPAIMKNRKPVNLKTIIKYYNIIQIIANGILCYIAFKEIFVSNNNLICLRHDGPAAKLVYYYYLNKISDLSETIFFVLKKSWRQISFLHVYHHIMVISVSYIEIYIQPGGQSLYGIMLNSFVHCCMYLYYLVSLAKPDFIYLQTFKKTVTQIQITQFIILAAINLGYMFTNCSDKKLTILSVCFLVQSIYLLYMFSVFYYNTYLKKKVE